MTIKTIHALITGRVQGVFFRDYTRKEALRLGLNGWVRNRPDSSVETMFSGPDNDVQQMISWLHTGSPLARVDTVRTREQQTEDPLPPFEIRY